MGVMIPDRMLIDNKLMKLIVPLGEFLKDNHQKTSAYLRELMYDDLREIENQSIALVLATHHKLTSKKPQGKSIFLLIAQLDNHDNVKYLLHRLRM
ncbi:hypothetical protein D3C80_1316840 [compost metagenome]